MAAQWYQTHLGGATSVLLLTNDRENKRKAIEEGISAETGLYNMSLYMPALYGFGIIFIQLCLLS